MPVTKTARRALRVSLKKAQVNKKTLAALEKAMRKASKTKTKEAIKSAISLADRAAKKKVIHRNKAARIKITLTKLLPKKSSKVKPKKK